MKNKDSIVIVKHFESDTLVVDSTFCIDKEGDTTLIVDNYATEIKILEKLLERDDFGKSFLSILILIFVIYSVLKRRKNG